MILKSIFILIGLIFIITGIMYSKNYHDKNFATDYSYSTGYSGSLLGSLVEIILGFLLSSLPWYVLKIVLILIGILLIMVPIFLL